MVVEEDTEVLSIIIVVHLRHIINVGVTKGLVLGHTVLVSIYNKLEGSIQQFLSYIECN